VAAPVFGNAGQSNFENKEMAEQMRKLLVQQQQHGGPSMSPVPASAPRPPLPMPEKEWRGTLTFLGHNNDVRKEVQLQVRAVAASNGSPSLYVFMLVETLKMD
jgi:hypothetical protein